MSQKKETEMKKTAKLSKVLTQAIVVKRNEQEPEKVELIAAAILECAHGFKRMANAGLKRETIVTLIMDNSQGIGKPAIREVLRVAEKLDELCLARR